MNDITIYLENPDKSYTEGVALFSKYSKNRSLIAYFNQKSPSDISVPHFQKLIYELKKYSSETSVIRVEQPQVNEVVEIDRSKQQTTQLLSFDWTKLNYQSKQYFNNNEALFLSKKAKLIEISRSDNEMKALHAKLTVVESDQEREDIVNKLLQLDKEKTDAWQFIDKWNNETDDVVDDNADDQTEGHNENSDTVSRDLLKLRVKISKLKKKIEEKPESEKQEEWRKELIKLQVELNAK